MSQLTNTTSSRTMEPERIAALAWGAILFISGISNIRNLAATFKTVAGGYLLYRGVQTIIKNQEADNDYMSDDESDLNEALYSEPDAILTETHQHFELG